MALELFHPVVRGWFERRYGEPTEIQRLAWPRILAGENVLVTAPTGSGKTLTGFLWPLDRLLTGAWEGGGLRVLYVSPLKALNADIERNLQEPLAGLRAAFEVAGEEPPPSVRVGVRSGDTPQGERGLLGLAFHPGFESNGYFFVFYLAPNGPNYRDRLSRFTADPVTLTVNTNTQQILFDVVDEVFNHNGGDLHFGPDGYLYISVGDEGDQNDSELNSQRIDKDFFSGILRIDVDKRPGNLEPNPHPNPAASDPAIGAMRVVQAQEH